MKKLLLTLFISSSSFAAEYNCYARTIKMSLDLKGDMSQLTVKDVQTGEFYYNGIIEEVIRREEITELIFDTHSNKDLEFQFKTSSLDNQNERLFGFVRGWYGAGFIDQSLQCLKKST
jgi:hypothetical protein